MKKRGLITILLLIFVFTAGCTQTPQVTATITIDTQEPAAPTEITAPTATTLPMAVLVNGEGILLTGYEAEVLRLQDALPELGMEMTPEEQKTRIVNNFVEELLLAQAAVTAGQQVSDEDVQARIDQS